MTSIKMEDIVRGALKQKRLRWGDLSLKVKGVKVLRVDPTLAGGTANGTGNADRIYAGQRLCIR